VYFLSLISPDNDKHGFVSELRVGGERREGEGLASTGDLKLGTVLVVCI
jgi:hypothetical protein